MSYGHRATYHAVTGGSPYQTGAHSLTPLSLYSVSLWSFRDSNFMYGSLALGTLGVDFLLDQLPKHLDLPELIWPIAITQFGPWSSSNFWNLYLSRMLYNTLRRYHATRVSIPGYVPLMHGNEQAGWYGPPRLTMQHRNTLEIQG